MGGDTISPSVESITYKGSQMIDAWNAIGLDYAVFGNHEFDFGKENYAKLVGVSGLTIYNWESGTNRPRASQLPAIAAVRRMGKREALARLEQLSK